MKVKLAQWRWRLVGVALAVVVVRTAAGIILAGDGGGRLGVVAVTVMDAVGLALVGVIIAAFVLYGRIYRARVPTE